MRYANTGAYTDAVDREGPSYERRMERLRQRICYWRDCLLPRMLERAEEACIEWALMPDDKIKRSGPRWDAYQDWCAAEEDILWCMVAARMEVEAPGLHRPTRTAIKPLLAERIRRVRPMLRKLGVRIRPDEIPHR